MRTVLPGLVVLVATLAAMHHVACSSSTANLPPTGQVFDAAIAIDSTVDYPPENDAASDVALAMADASDSNVAVDAGNPCEDPLDCSKDGVPYPKDRWGFRDRLGNNTFADGGIYISTDAGLQLPDASAESTLASIGKCRQNRDGTPIIDPGSAPGARWPNAKQQGFSPVTVPLGKTGTVAPSLVFDPNQTSGASIGKFVDTQNPSFLTPDWLRMGAPVYIMITPESRITLSQARTTSAGLGALVTGSVISFALDATTSPSYGYLPPFYPNRFYVDLRSMEILQYCTGGPDPMHMPDPFAKYWQAWAAANPPSY
jgi:hypothetical protein